MHERPQFQLGEKVFVRTPRSTEFRRRSKTQTHVAGRVVGFEPGEDRRGRNDDWWYYVKLTWDEPWIEVSETELAEQNVQGKAQGEP